MHSCRTSCVKTHFHTQQKGKKTGHRKGKIFFLNVLSIHVQYMAVKLSNVSKRAVIVLFRVCNIFMAHKVIIIYLNTHRIAYPRPLSCLIILLANDYA